MLQLPVGTTSICINHQGGALVLKLITKGTSLVPELITRGITVVLTFNTGGFHYHGSPADRLYECLFEWLYGYTDGSMVIWMLEWWCGYMDSFQVEWL